MIPNNIYAPFPFPLHLGFCIFATLFLIIQFFRKKHLYYILLILGIDLTFATQFNKITENELIGTVISVFFRFLVEIRLLPRSPTILPTRTSHPIRIFRQRRQVKL